MEQSIESIEILTLETENHTVPSQQHSEAISWMSDELKTSQKKTLKKRERNICSVVHCRSYREANHWPEPLTFHEFPADLKRRELWLKVRRYSDEKSYSMWSSHQGLRLWLGCFKQSGPRAAIILLQF